jgi:hypothetical protein
MRRTSLVVAVLVAVLALSATAGAEFNSFAEARRGSLHVLSSVLVSGHSVDIRGGWFNTSLSCTTSRRLRVRAEIQRTTAHSSAITGTAKTGRVMNCAEGGPNFGFTISPSEAAGMACPDGSWKRGGYDFLTRTRHVRSGVVAVATLSWRNREAC